MASWRDSLGDHHTSEFSSQLLWQSLCLREDKYLLTSSLFKGGISNPIPSACQAAVSVSRSGRTGNGLPFTLCGRLPFGLARASISGHSLVIQLQPKQMDNATDENKDIHVNIIAQVDAQLI